MNRKQKSVGIMVLILLLNPPVQGGIPYGRDALHALSARARSGRPDSRSSTSARATGQSPLSIQLEEVAMGLTSPVALTHAGDGSGRLFVVDQAGLIRIIENGVLLPTPFLDLTTELPALSGFFDERGLLGMAFHPDYAVNGRFFVRHSAPRAGDPAEPCNDPGGFIVGCHKEVLAEYHVSAMDPNVADPGSRIVLFEVDEPEFNHNSGSVHFGPDGYLYFSLGDGGGANDGLNLPTLPHGPIGNGQNIDTPLGSLLRIDVDAPPQLPLAYAIPATNPFVGTPGLDEIYAYGFRNPFGFSFDDGPGGDNSLYLADVGQNLFEEVDIVTQGGNFGWAVREGAHCFDPFSPGMPPVACPSAGMIDPISEYTHVDGGLAIIGGFVYRGSQSSALTGKYIYGDFSADFGPTGRLYYFDITGPDVYQRREFFLAPNGDPLGLYLKGIGEDEDGEVYYLASAALAPNGNTGVVFRIVGEPLGACCLDLVSCVEVQELQCGDKMGTFLGAGTTCGTDADGDNADDLCEQCPTDPGKTEPGICGCGSPDVDTDGDGTLDCLDVCPLDGVDNDSDQDGVCVPDDQCPTDPDKTAPGACGCGIQDDDVDNDGVADCAEIPTVSTWGLVLIALLLLTLAKLRFGALAVTV